MLHLDSPVSSGLPSRCVYDVELTLSGRITTIVAGDIAMTPEVTR